MNYKFIPDSIEIDHNREKVPANIAHATIVPLKNSFTVCLFSTQQMPRILPDITADRLASHSY